MKGKNGHFLIFISILYSTVHQWCICICLTTYPQSSARPLFSNVQSASSRWLRWLKPVRPPLWSTHWGRSHRGRSTSCTAARSRTVAPLTPSYSSLAYQKECSSWQHFQISQCTNQKWNCTFVSIFTSEITLKKHLPVRVRADVGRGVVLINPVLLGIIREDLFWDEKD